MTDISYSIDETKLMMKLERCKRRLKEQRHYSEYLKCKLAKKALQNHKLKEENAQLTEWLLDLQNGEKDAEIVRLNGWVDKLIDAGSRLYLELPHGWGINAEAWMRLIDRIQKEREE